MTDQTTKTTNEPQQGADPKDQGVEVDTITQMHEEAVAQIEQEHPHAEVEETLEKMQKIAERNAQKGEGDEEPDLYLQYLVEEHRRYRLLATVLAVCGVAIILICLTLIQAGIIPNRLYGVIMSVGNLFIVFMAVVIFTRTRPFKRRIKEYTGQPKSKIRDENAPDGVLIEDRGPAPDMDYMYKILERGVRTEVIVDTEEYHKLRRQWLFIFCAAAVVAIAACVLYVVNPATNIIASLMMIVAFVLVIVGFYIDRTKMKPMRNAYAASQDMTEFQMRNNMRDYDEHGNIRK